MAKDRKECFVVSAIGDDGSPQRLHADWVLEGIIKPTFAEHFKEFDVIRADQMNTPGLIDAQIIDQLLNADLVIADLTFLNPNAFYEIGIRHVVAKPIIHMNLSTERIPFDISLYLALKFSVTHPNDLVKAKGSLKGMVENVLAEGYEVENPVTKARGRVKFNETATAADKVLADQVEALMQRIGSLEKQLQTQTSPPHTWESAGRRQVEYVADVSLADAPQIKIIASKPPSATYSDFKRQIVDIAGTFSPVFGMQEDYEGRIEILLGNTLNDRIAPDRILKALKEIEALDVGIRRPRRRTS